MRRTFLKTVYADPFRTFSDDSLLRAAFALPIVCAPGACFHYAHTNFVLLGRVMEKVTHRSLTTLMTQRILRPLGMTQTRMSKLPSIPAPTLHAYTSERGVYEDSTYWSPSSGLSQAGLWTSTARDVIREFRAIGSGRLVSRSAYHQFATSLSSGLPGAPKLAGYGLGIVLGRGWLIQNPVQYGYSGIAAYLPSQRITLLIDATPGPKSTAKSVALEIFKAISSWLTPNNAFGA